MISPLLSISFIKLLTNLLFVLCLYYCSTCPVNVLYSSWAGAWFSQAFKWSPHKNASLPRRSRVSSHFTPVPMHQQHISSPTSWNTFYLNVKFAAPRTSLLWLLMLNPHMPFHRTLYSAYMFVWNLLDHSQSVPWYSLSTLSFLAQTVVYTQIYIHQFLYTACLILCAAFLIEVLQ